MFWSVTLDALIYFCDEVIGQSLIILDLWGFVLTNTPQS